MHHRRQRALHGFLLVSVLAHAAVILGLPDFLPQFAAPGAGPLEVTILAPQPLPTATKPLPDPPAAEEPRPIEQPRRDPRKTPARQVAKPAAPAPSPSPPAQDAEISGPPSAAPARGNAPPAAAPEQSAGAARQAVTPPSFNAAYLSNPAPQYPPAARRAGQQGTVTLRVMVRRDGLPSRVEIEKSSGSRLLDTAAQEAVWAWRFSPARQGADPVESWVLVPVVFRLEG